MQRTAGMAKKWPLWQAFLFDKSKDITSNPSHRPLPRPLPSTVAFLVSTGLVESYATVKAAFKDPTFGWLAALEQAALGHVLAA